MRGEPGDPEAGWQLCDLLSDGVCQWFGPKLGGKIPQRFNHSPSDEFSLGREEQEGGSLDAIRLAGFDFDGNKGDLFDHVITHSHGLWVGLAGH